MMKKHAAIQLQISKQRCRTQEGNTVYWTVYVVPVLLSNACHA